MTETPPQIPLLRAMLRYARLRKQSIDAQHLAAVMGDGGKGGNGGNLGTVMAALGLRAPRAFAAPDPARCPLISQDPDGAWQIVVGLQDNGLWRVQRGPDLLEDSLADFPPQTRFWRLDFTLPFALQDSPSFRLILAEMLAQKWRLAEMVVAGMGLTILAIVVSIFSMQVYDRVIPSASTATLAVLFAGLLMALLFEFVLKLARAGLVERMTDAIDQSLSRSIMARFLAIRLEQLPAGVGAAAQRLKGYESVRGFLVSAAATALVDLPIALFLLGVIWAIGGVMVLIPLGFFVVGLSMSILFRARAARLADAGQNAHSRKTGILVETVEAMETIKANAAGWRMLGRWLDASDAARSTDADFRNLTEDAQTTLILFQQLSYALIIALGALRMIDGQMTMGGLIGCSILSGRILTPIARLPGATMQWAQAKIGLAAVDAYWALAQDTPPSAGAYAENLCGAIAVSGLRNPSYGAGSLVIDVPHLRIEAGEKLAIIGAVGSGKSSLLRLLAGLVRPAEGMVRLADLPMTAYANTTIAQNIGYVQQNGRLISGTIRDNLLLGIADRGDGEIIAAARRFGAYDLAIKSALAGLDTPINESGAGLSGGQAQLIQITRAAMKGANFLMMDEPTASMDMGTEAAALAGLDTLLTPQTTLIVVTHKAQILTRVDRIIVMAAGRIVADGPARDILAGMMSPSHAPKSVPSS